VLIKAGQYPGNPDPARAFVAGLQETNLNVLADYEPVAKALQTSRVRARQIINRCALYPPAPVLQLAYFDNGVANHDPVDRKTPVKKQAVQRYADAHNFGSDPLASVRADQLRIEKLELRTT